MCADHDLAGFVYVYLFIPETKGLSLEEVDELYRSPVKPWNSVGWRPHLLDEIHEHVKTDEVTNEKHAGDDTRIETEESTTKV